MVTLCSLISKDFDNIFLKYFLICYFCQIASNICNVEFIYIANSRGCDFTNNGSCYRTYQVDPDVDWYDAQAGCEAWGGNLASVLSEEENLLLFTRTPIRAFSCWIGMYTVVNGTNTWNDGNIFDYTKSLSPSPPNCINWNAGGSDVWLNGNCDALRLGCYVCKRVQTTVSIAGKLKATNC